MNVRTPIALVAAALITAANLYGIATYSSAATNPARLNERATTEVSHTRPAITTLPAITVRPTREQLRQVRGHDVNAAGPATTAVGGSQMPYYSFAASKAGI